MLKLKEITKDYKVASGSVHALKGVSLNFRKREFVCVLGQSGCGKTTLLNIIGGLDHYSSGDLVIQGKSTKDFKDRDWDVYRNHRIGFIFQSYNLIPHQTVLGNVELALTIAGVGREERQRRAAEALARVGLGEELDKKPNQLSGGQMQRVAIARALVNNPDILLADEPTGALDSKTSVEVMDLIREIAGERLVIMVTHNPDLAEKYATRTVRLHDGLVEEDSMPYSDEEEAAERAVEEPEEVSSEEGPSEPGEKSVRTNKKPKKLRARMSLLTSLALSAKNLLTKKGRTIVTSVAGSIGIISVCLVLALSSGFNNYIRRTEEDMLSYYPVEISENTLDLTAVMEKAGSSLSNLPDMSRVEDKVYVDSFLTQLAQGIAVTNDLSEEYRNYLQTGKEEHPEWFAAIKYGYGLSLVDNLFTDVETGFPPEDGQGEDKPLKTQYLSLSGLRELYTNEITELAPEYSALVKYVNFFDDVVGIMPGTSDFTDDEYAEYVLSQYDVVDPETMHFPENENEAVLVVGNNNQATDLTLAQLGFIPEERFVDLFNMGVEGSDQEGKFESIDFSKVLEKSYVLYYNDAVYTQGGESGSFSDQPFTYSDNRGDLASQNAKGDPIGIPLRISAVLRLKEGRTYGCLTNGLNFTEAALLDYIDANMASEIVTWMQSDAAKLPDKFVNAVISMANLSGYGIEGAYLSPSSHLNSAVSNSSPVYSTIDLGTYRSVMSAKIGKGFVETIESNKFMQSALTDGSLPLTREGMLDFFENNGSRIEYKMTHSEKMPFTAEEASSLVSQMEVIVRNLPETFTHEQLEAALGAPIVDLRDKEWFGIDLQGTLFVTFSPDTAVRLLGGNKTPNKISVYPTDFDGKDHVLEYLDAWNSAENREESQKITYTDRVGLLMGIMQTMLDVITYVLVAFTSISLVVSSVMIGIITYVSVVERVKEIGVLRSLGARKQDIKNLFNAETFIIGLAAGLIGVAVTYVLCIIISAIIASLSGIGGIAMLPPLSAVIMVCVSVCLTLISGLIPASAAAKKDPVIALRTE